MAPILCHDKRKSITDGMTPPLVLKRHTLDLIMPPMALPIDRNSEICRIFAIGKRHLPSAECEQAESGLRAEFRKSVMTARTYAEQYAAESDRRELFEAAV